MFSVLLMTGTLAVPLVMPPSAAAAEGHVGATVTVRTYDPYRHDYHRWDQREERAYRAYLARRHRAYIAYQRQRAAERRAYWRWRHQHP
jgi:hypothetical protein